MVFLGRYFCFRYFSIEFREETHVVAGRRACWKFLRSGYQIDARFFQIGFSRGGGGVSWLWVGSGWEEGWCLLGLASNRAGEVLGWVWEASENFSIMKTCTCTQNGSQKFSGCLPKSIDCCIQICLKRCRWRPGAGDGQPAIMRRHRYG